MEGFKVYEMKEEPLKCLNLGFNVTKVELPFVNVTGAVTLSYSCCCGEHPTKVIFITTASLILLLL